MRPKSKDKAVVIKIGKSVYEYLKARQSEINITSPVQWTLRNVLDEIVLQDKRARESNERIKP